MFLHNLKYEIKMNLRAKEVIIWMLLFPCVLSVLYKAAFGNIYENGGIKTVPVAVVENVKDDMFGIMMGLMGEVEYTYTENDSNVRKWFSKLMAEKTGEDVDTEDTPLFHATFCSEEEAYKMLEDGDVKGIIFVDALEGADNNKDEAADEIPDVNMSDLSSKTIRRILDEFGVGYEGFGTGDDFEVEDYLKNEGLTLKDMNELKDMLENKSELSLKIRSNGMEQSSLKRFLEMYRTLMLITSKIAEKGDMDSTSVMDTVVIEELKLTDGNTDPFVTYMYNMIAMVALFGMTVALHIALYSEANLSTFGARRSCSSTPKFTTVMAGLCACCITQIFCVAVTVTFQAFVLKIDFGGRLPYVYLGGALGAIMGVSMGFFVGAIGRIKYEAKIGISMAVVMTLSFMSGLMVSGIKGVLEINAPIVNDLNPVAIVADSFYYLSVDADLSRYYGKLAAIGIYTVVFVMLGFLLTRRRKYESL